MIKIKNLFFMLVLASFLINNSVSAYVYNFEFTDMMSGTDSGESVPIDIYYEPQDNISVTDNILTSGSTSIDDAFYFYKNETSYNSMTYTGSIGTCQNIGSKSFLSNENFSHKITFSDIVTNSGTFYHKSKIKLTTSERFINIIMNDTIDANAYLAITGIGTFDLPHEKFYYDSVKCGSPYITTILKNKKNTPSDFIYAQMIPFNSTTGNVSIIIKPLPDAVSRLIEIYEYENPTNIIYYSNSIAEINYNSEYLNSSIIYILGIKNVFPSGHPSYSSNNTEIKITIDLKLTDWSCSEWTSCDNNITSRDCIDLSGKFPPKTETISCAIISNKSVSLGFENYITVSDVAKCVPAWFFGCGWYNSNITVDRPEGWTEWLDGLYGINFHSNFMRMTSEWAIDGTRSLKMWSIPAMEGIPVDYELSCVNTTSALFLGINKTISSAIMSSEYNITFPSDKIHLSFYARSCLSNELHNDALVNAFGIELCGKKYYASNESISPTSNFLFDLKPYDSNSVFGTPYYLSAPEIYWKFIDGNLVDYWLPSALAQKYEFDLSGLGIVAGKPYSLKFAPFKENPQDRSGNCILLDDVRYWVDETEFESLTSCESKCIGNDYYTASRNSAGKCSTIKIQNYPDCFSDTKIAEAVRNLEDYCNGTTRYFFNSKKSIYEISDNNSVCIAEEETKTNQDALYGGGDSLAFAYNIAMFLLSPITVSFFIIVLLMAGIQTLTNEWRLSVFVGFGLMLLLTIAGFFDALITFSLLALIILLASIKIAGATMGRDRGG